MEAKTRFKEMTDGEFSILKKKVISQDLSPYAQFCVNAMGFKFETRKGSSLDKWEVFFMGFQNAEKIINGKTKIVAVPVK